MLTTAGAMPAVALTDNRESGFDSGEAARETATTSKEGSRHANYPLRTPRGSDAQYRCGALSRRRNRNEYTSNPLTRIHWRASLVPAAAVIPAPAAYIYIAAFKKLVVEAWDAARRTAAHRPLLVVAATGAEGARALHLTVRPRRRCTFTLNKSNRSEGANCSLHG